MYLELLGFLVLVSHENQLKSELKNLILVVRKSSFEKILIDETNFSCINNLNINLCFYQLYKNRLSDLNLRVGILKHTDDFHTFNSCQVFCQKNANCKTFQAFDTIEEAMSWGGHVHPLAA